MIKSPLTSSFFIVLSLLICIPLGWLPVVERVQSIEQAAGYCGIYWKSFLYMQRGSPNYLYRSFIQSFTLPVFVLVFSYIIGIIRVLVPSFTSHVVAGH